MKLSKITDLANKNCSGTFWTPMFHSGYLAYVYGGKIRVHDSKTGKFIRATGGIQPFDYLTAEEKTEWQKGVEYARKERKECREL